MEERRDGEIIFCGEKINSRAYEGPLWPFLKARMQLHGSRTALVMYTFRLFCVVGVVFFPAMCNLLFPNSFKSGDGEGWVNRLISEAVRNESGVTG